MAEAKKLYIRYLMGEFDSNKPVCFRDETFEYAINLALKHPSREREITHDLRMLGYPV